jgi:hypothetical protein
MQSIRAESTVKTEQITTTETHSLRQSGPVELDLATLEKVSGGVSPKGTWATTETAAVVSPVSPKGTW